MTIPSDALAVVTGIIVALVGAVVALWRLEHKRCEEDRADLKQARADLQTLLSGQHGPVEVLPPPRPRKGPERS